MLLRIPSMRIFLVVGAVLTLAHPARGQIWPTVPPVDFSVIQFSQFADHELEVPYHLRHFAQVANAVVETPFTDSTGTSIPRGFLNIKVNREPADNQPYNARIMEMQAALAYFYTADRAWNPYRGNQAIRLRLEAMLLRWTEMQAPPGHSHAGLFTEYSPTNWSLSPTSFGARHAAEALDLILDSGLPFDAVVLENARVSLRRALMALFTRSDMRDAAKQYSNQFSGAFHAALIYLENWPDADLETSFIAAVNAASAQDQSPAGFWYEQGGPDFGYSSVHESSMRMALPRFRNRADLMPVLLDDDEDWNAWLAANHVPQPGLATRTFLTNAGINTRTSHALQTPRSRPWSEWVETSRVFAFNDAEFALSVAARRAQVSSQFGKWGALSVPNAYSYIPSFVHDARLSLDTWHPTAAQRDAAQATLPCMSSSPMNLQFHDPRPTTYTMAKRPGYYAAVTTGNIRLSRQAYGLGLLWNPAFGIGLQSVAGTLAGNPWVYGTTRSGMISTYETASIPTTITAGGSVVAPANGSRVLPAGDLEFTYSLGGSGSKTIQLASDAVVVSITHSGDFSELLPLAHADDAVVSAGSTRLMLERPNGSWLLVETTTPGTGIAVGSVSPFSTGLVRRPVTITASGTLGYRITMGASQPPPPAPALTVADAEADQPVSGNAVMVFPVSLSAVGDAPITVTYQTTQGSAMAGIHFTASSGSLEFQPGEILKSIEVPILPGSLAQGNQLAFGVAMGTPSGAIAGRLSATGTIRGTAPPPPPPPGSVLVEFIPGNGWDGAYQGTFRITNSTTATITGWELDFDFTGTSITFFNGNLSKSGIRHTFAPLSWQSTIGPGQVFDNLGFQASPNAAATVPSNLSLRVTSATGVLPLQIISSSLPTLARGIPASHTLQAGGGMGPYTWSIGPGSTLPTGLTFAPSGNLEGIPATNGESTLFIRARDLRGMVEERSMVLRIEEMDPWLAWQSTVAWDGEDPGLLADADKDGVSNLIEYALGGDPLVPERVPLANMVRDGDKLRFTFRRIADPQLLYEVQAADHPGVSPASWQTVWSSTGQDNAAGMATVEETLAEPFPGSRFLRLKIQRSSLPLP